MGYKATGNSNLLAIESLLNGDVLLWETASVKGVGGFSMLIDPTMTKRLGATLNTDSDIAHMELFRTLVES